MKEKNYPIEYSDEEIIEKIKSQSKYLMVKDLTPAAAAKYSGRITIGLTELQNRKQSKLNELLQELNTEINLLNRITTHFSDKQLNSLKDLDNSLDHLNSEVDTLNSTSEQQGFRLDYLGELNHILNEEILKFRTASAKASRSSNISTYISIGLVVISIIISGFALNYALTDYEGDKTWEENQINAIDNLYKGIRSLEKTNIRNLKRQDSILSELNNTIKNNSKIQETLLRELNNNLSAK